METLTLSEKSDAKTPQELEVPTDETIPNRFELEPVQQSLFKRDENGKLKFDDSTFVDCDFSNIEEISALGQELVLSIKDTFGELESLDVNTITLDQVRQAFGGIKENFCLNDVFDVASLINSTKFHNNNKTYFYKIIFMQNMLKMDYATRLANEARQYLESDESSMEDLSFVFGKFDNIAFILDRSDNNLAISEIALEYLKQYPEIISDKKQIFRWLTRFYKYDSTIKDGTETITKILCDNNPDLVDKDEATKQIQIDYIKRYFYLYLSSGRKAPDIENNYESLVAIEKQIPGIAKFLEEELGVIDFGRYPEQLLLDQYLLKDDLDSPYGVLLYPKSDHNGAFHDSQFVLEEFYEEIKSLGFNLRISERDGKFGAARSLLGFNKKYGDKQKISFAIVGGHGTENSIQFGDEILTTDENGSLYAEDLTGSGIQRALSSEFFIEKPTLILSSCSTGVAEGIGQNISGITDFEVIAPDRSTSLSKINITLDDDKKLHFEVEYHDGEDVDIKYVGGHKVPDEIADF